MNAEATTVEKLLEGLRHATTVERRGRLVEAIGTTLKVTGIDARIGQACEIVEPATGQSIPAEVIGIAGQAAILTPLADVRGLSVDAEVIVRPGEDRIPYGPALLGRVLDGRGAPIDGLGPIADTLPRRPLHAPAPQPMARALIDTPMETGVRAIDTLLTVGAGQRVGVFAAAGGGKSTLLGMLARFCVADVIVIALIGERGREVREFIEDNLGAEGLARSVIVCATSDRPAMERVRAAHHATAIAEGFREEGKRVLLLMDSVTRFARALREIGLAAGEPPTVRAYTPNVFAAIPRLIERAGALASGGSISAIMTVLCETDAADDPLCEIMKSLLDGHILLSRELAEQGHFPAIDIARSVSRQASLVRSGEGRAAMQTVCSWISAFEQSRTMRQAGLYVPGNDPLIDQAVARHPAIERFLRQEGATAVSALETDRLLADLVRGEAA